LDELEDHLHRECKAIMWREELISKSKLRKEPIQCILCGEMCPMEDMRSHEVDILSFLSVMIFYVSNDLDFSLLNMATVVSIFFLLMKLVPYLCLCEYLCTYSIEQYC